jgi:hypothetical protein
MVRAKSMVMVENLIVDGDSGFRERSAEESGDVEWGCEGERHTKKEKTEVRVNL